MSNVDTEKVFFGVVLDELQGAFPAAHFVDRDAVWEQIAKHAEADEIAIKDGQRGFRTITVTEALADTKITEHYTKMMLEWMKVEGYLHPDPTSNLRNDYVLSAKSLAVLNKPIECEDVSLGQKLAQIFRQVGSKAEGELITQSVDKAIGIVEGAVQ